MNVEIEKSQKLLASNLSSASPGIVARDCVDNTTSACARCNAQQLIATQKFCSQRGACLQSRSRQNTKVNVKRTIELRPEMIEVREDFKGCDGRPNTDGSGLISADLMTEIAECVGCPGRRISLVKFSKGSTTGMHVCSNNIARRPSVIVFAE